MTDYMLTGHKCRPIARMKMGKGRDWWLGELLEPIQDYPNETHCLHIKTPLKEIVLGVNVGDMEQLAVLCQIVAGHRINPHWLDSMEQALRKRAESSFSAFVETATKNENLQCSVTDAQGNHCPGKPTHTEIFKGELVHLCDRCYANVLAGAYRERCPRCKTEVPADAMECGRCGKRF